MYFHNSNYHVRPKHALHLTSNNCQNLVVIESFDVIHCWTVCFSARIICAMWFS